MRWSSDQRTAGSAARESGSFLETERSSLGPSAPAPRGLTGRRAQGAVQARGPKRAGSVAAHPPRPSRDWLLPWAWLCPLDSAPGAGAGACVGIACPGHSQVLLSGPQPTPRSATGAE